MASQHMENMKISFKFSTLRLLFLYFLSTEHIFLAPQCYDFSLLIWHSTTTNTMSSSCQKTPTVFLYIGDYLLLITMNHNFDSRPCMCSLKCFHRLCQCKMMCDKWLGVDLSRSYHVQRCRVAVKCNWIATNLLSEIKQSFPHPVVTNLFFLWLHTVT